MKTKIEEIIKKVNETESTIEGSKELVNQLFKFNEYISNGIIKFERPSKEWIIERKMDDLFRLYTINKKNDIKQMIDIYTGKLNHRTFQLLKTDFLKFLDDALCQIK